MLTRNRVSEMVRADLLALGLVPAEPGPGNLLQLRWLPFVYETEKQTRRQPLLLQQ